MTPIRATLLLLTLWLTPRTLLAQDPVQVVASQKQAVAAYPDLAKAGSPLHAAFVAEYERLKAAGSPELKDPRWPEALAARCADKLGVAAASEPLKPNASAGVPAAPSGTEGAKKPGSAPAPALVWGHVERVDKEGIVVSCQKSAVLGIAKAQGWILLANYPQVEKVVDGQLVDVKAVETDGVFRRNTRTMKVYRFESGEIRDQRAGETAKF